MVASGGASVAANQGDGRKATGKAVEIENIVTDAVENARTNLKKK